jgi:hypothetical protein
MFQGGVRTGRVAFYDFSSVTFPAPKPDTTITTPTEGRVWQTDTPESITGSASVTTGTVGRVGVQITNRDNNRYLTAANTWTTTVTTLPATLDPGTGTNRTWHLDGVSLDDSYRLLVSAQACTAATGGTCDATRATKRIESFGTDDQTPSTSLSGPSGIQTSTSFTVTGSATDDLGVNAVTIYFRDDQGRYLQNDGSADAIYNQFRFTPDVIGGTNTTWSYDVTLPHEGDWLIGANAVDTTGQSDLRAAQRTVTINSNAVAPTVTVEQPAPMTPPFTVPAVTVAPGGKLTFSGTAADDEGLGQVLITLRNSSTGENLGNDCTWGVQVSAGSCRISPVDISGANYNWSWTTPFNLSAGTYAFTVRAVDDDGISTASANRGSLTINAQIPGDLPPDTVMSFTAPTDKSLVVNLAGTATDDHGVASVKVSLQDRDSGRYLQPNGTMAAALAFRDATLGTPNGTTTTWSLGALTLPTQGNWRFTAIAFDSVGQQDTSTTGATGSYAVYPNDGVPTIDPTLGGPVTGDTFTEGVIVVSGRANDAADVNASIQSVQIGVVNAAGQYMSSSGTFTSTTPSFRTAFLNSPGSVGSNFSYTTPVIPSGTYTVLAQAVAGTRPTRSRPR